MVIFTSPAVDLNYWLEILDKVVAPIGMVWLACHCFSGTSQDKRVSSFTRKGFWAGVFLAAAITVSFGIFCWPPELVATSQIGWLAKLLWMMAGAVVGVGVRLLHLNRFRRWMFVNQETISAKEKLEKEAKTLSDIIAAIDGSVPNPNRLQELQASIGPTTTSVNDLQTAISAVALGSVPPAVNQAAVSLTSTATALTSTANNLWTAANGLSGSESALKVAIQSVIDKLPKSQRSLKRIWFWAAGVTVSTGFGLSSLAIYYSSATPNKYPPHLYLCYAYGLFVLAYGVASFFGD